MVREVAFSNSKQAGNGGHEFVIDPNAAHSIVDGRENHHGVVILHTVNLLGKLARINIGNLFIHVEKVAITLKNGVDTETINRLGKVEEHG